MLQRFLDPATLASISGLDLVAKTVVDGFVAGLHRSPDFGFSQEFAEYRAYTQGDDLRHVDWNVFARTERCYLKRYRGETNSQLLVLLDTSASMGYGSQPVTKLDYARFVAASLCYLAQPAARCRGADHLRRRRDELRRSLPRGRDSCSGCCTPSSRPKPGTAHRLRQALRAFPEFPAPARHRGRDLGFLRAARTTSSRPSSRCAIRGNEVILFHVLDPQEIAPKFREPVAAGGHGEPRTRSKFRRNTRATSTAQKIDAHIEALRDKARGGGHGLFPDEHRPSARRRAARISVRAAGEDVDGLSGAMVSGRSWRPWACRSGCTCCSKHQTTPLPFSSLMFFERRTQSSIKHRRLRYLLLFALRTALCSLLLALAFAHAVRPAAAFCRSAARAR